MKKMQWPVQKILWILLPLFFLCTAPTLSQISNYRLQRADSLFNAKQYTQSLDHYKQIFSQNQYSPAMLLKMAFIEEGLNHIGEAMYYLNLYYNKTSDESAVEKMDQLAEKYKLEGYHNTSTDYDFSFYRQYELHIAIALSAIIFLLFALMVFQARKRRRPVALFITLLFFCIILFSHVRLVSDMEKAIVVAGNTYIMEGPSGAAPVVAIISPGHRLSVISREDSWIQVQWKDRRAYIRENRLLPIHRL